jgi:hypothetical protein
MSEITNQVPASPTAPPPPSPPGPGASPYEWRAYRRDIRHRWRSERMNHGRYGPWGWGMFFASALVLIGVYYVLRNSGVLGWFPEDVFWPIVLIAWGVALLLRIGTWARRA